MTSKHSSKEKQFLLGAIALGMVPGVGAHIFRSLIAHFGSAQAVWDVPPGELQKVKGVGAKLSAHLKNPTLFFDAAQQQIDRCSLLGIRLLSLQDPAYPFRLKQIADAPPVIYVYGEADLNPHRSIAVVGTRRATAYGLDFLTDFIDYLKPYQPTIVSGLAYGIDIHAHKRALATALPTIGVMASGMNIIYPQKHRNTAVEMVKCGGALITESPLDTSPDAMLFPARNRIIAGLCDAVVVIEAMASGGALITAELANDYNREVLALGGPYHSKYSEGCNNLVKQQRAHLMTTPEDLVSLLNWQLPTDEQDAVSKKFEEFLSNEEMAVVTFLQKYGQPIHRDELLAGMEMEDNQLLSTLLSLELQSIVQNLPGNQVVLRR
ncbi:DNA-processing protein DprA [Persicobacter psychrovividus]|uniref:DNA processing protein DprA n=1 Tax=Persicobacter psychrovividus TaxID=387638 RepID=A0ABN6L9C8_9BACT|nr:DNA processing protein DprA [Persicobacter psychrovividus]